MLHRARDVPLRGVGTPGRCVATIGKFDGVHRGHQQLVDGVVSRARRLGVASAVITFDPHPLAVVRPELAPMLLTSLERRIELLRDRGVDRVVVLPFTAEVSRWTPSEFVHRVLGTAVGAVEVHVGENFRFGHRAAGDVGMMSRVGRTQGFTVRCVPLAGSSARWSSTCVRELLAECDVEAAADVLGRPHRLVGRVERGRGDGPRLLAVDATLALPAGGTYAGTLVGPGGRRLAAEVQIGGATSPDGRRIELRTPVHRTLRMNGEAIAFDVTRCLRIEPDRHSTPRPHTDRPDDQRRPKSTQATV